MKATRVETRRGGALGRWGIALGAVSAGILLAGCDEVLVVDRSCDGAHAPVGLYSVTGDGEVALYWVPVGGDVEEFVVYRSSSIDGLYYEIGHTHRDYFVDREVLNGRTYFYAVSALDVCGYESELSREIAFDTPRPEGFGDRLFDADGDDWRRSGWDFSSYHAVSWDHPDADVYFLVSGGVPYLVAADLRTDIQDAGYAGFDDIDWAPAQGWSPTGVVEAIPGHAYVVWTRDDHFAKVRVRDVLEGSVTFDWGYQIDTGNPELAPRPPRDGSPLGPSSGRGA